MFKSAYSFVLEDRNGQLMGALIADDEQWRFPASDSLPEVFIHALLTFEDKRFYRHLGIDLMAVVRAMRDNISSRKIVSGGSTISMQLARMIRNSETRSLWDKTIEALMAMRLELRYSKGEILLLYAAHAPFGGNVVGLEAASWRYFGKGPDNMGWAEAATLAVLPNSPSLIHPGRNREQLKSRRNKLLGNLKKKGYFDDLSMELYMEEMLPKQPYPLPSYAPQLLQLSKRESPSLSRYQTTVDKNFQLQVNEKVAAYSRQLLANHIHHAAVLVIDFRKNEVMAYTANIPGADLHQSGNQLDLIRARRSTGSILKPFLYAALLNEGQILPQALVVDIPTRYGSFSPQNFNKTFEGAVPADEALARSLNIPAVRKLQLFGTEKFYRLLRDLGMSSLDQPHHHYGLSLILGGAEGTLWDIAAMYASMGRTLHEYPKLSSRYKSNQFRFPDYRLHQEEPPEFDLISESLLGAAAIWQTMETLSIVERPISEMGWRRLSSSRQIAWKTGTSYGFRDAWAVGMDANYAVAVWIGNADGEGRPGLTGVEAAAPLLFDVFDGIPQSGTWFPKPFDDQILLEVCRASGFKAGTDCLQKDSVLVPANGILSPVCPYHRLIHTDPTEEYRVHASCVPMDEIIPKKWFVLPPSMAWYYSKNNPSYQPLPPWNPRCVPGGGEQMAIELIYPRHQAHIFVPIELGGELEHTVFEAAHQIPGTTLHWHLNDEYVGSTKIFHQLAFQPPKGKHSLTIVDEWGNRLRQDFEVTN